MFKEKAASLLYDLQVFDSLIEERGGSRLKFLLFVAAKYPEAVRNADAVEKLGITQGQVSRIARSFASVTADKELGLGLVDINCDPFDPNTKLVTLNERGISVLERHLFTQDRA